MTDAGVNGPPEVVDLNADLGESFGAWRLGDDEALLDDRHQREHRLRLPRRRPADDAPAPAPARSRAAWPSAPRSPTGTWPGSVAGRWTCRPTS